MSARAAAAVEADLDDQWRAIDNVLTSLAQRSRARTVSHDEDPEELPVVRARTSSHDTEAALWMRLEEVSRERDQLRLHLTSTQRQLKSTRAALKRLTPPPELAGPGGSGPETVVLTVSARQVHGVSRPGRDGEASATAVCLRAIREYLGLGRQP